MSDRIEELVKEADELREKQREAEAAGDEEAAALHYQAAIRALKEAWVLSGSPTLGPRVEKVTR